MIKTYRKKPVKVEAIQWMGDNRPEVLDFCNTDGKLRASITGVTNIVVVRTLEGNMEARIGDYIIKGVKGEYYPCKPDIFRETYEEVSETIRYPKAGVVDKPEILYDSDGNTYKQTINKAAVNEDFSDIVGWDIFGDAPNKSKNKEEIAEGNWQAYEKFKELYDIGERKDGELTNGTEAETDNDGNCGGKS